MGPDRPEDSFGLCFGPNRRFSTHFGPNLMFSAPTGTLVSQDLGLAWLLLAAGCSWLTQTMKSKTLNKFCFQN